MMIIILKLLFWIIATPCILIAIGAVWLCVLWLIAKSLAERIHSLAY